MLVASPRREGWPDCRANPCVHTPSQLLPCSASARGRQQRGECAHRWMGPVEGQHAASLAPPLPPVATLGSQRGEGEAGVVTGGRSGTRFVTEWERREAGGVVVKKSSLWVPLWVVGIEYFLKKDDECRETGYKGESLDDQDIIFSFIKKKNRGWRVFTPTTLHGFFFIWAAVDPYM